MKLYITSDHGGFEDKQMLLAHLQQQGHQVEDLGPHELNQDDDYVDYAIALGERVTAESDAKGIALCRNGQGINIAANKVRGVRATTVWNVSVAQSSRQDDDANVLSLAADELTIDTMKHIVDTWLSTPFSAQERHQRRLRKLAEYDDGR